MTLPSNDFENSVLGNVFLTTLTHVVPARCTIMESVYPKLAQRSFSKCQIEGLEGKDLYLTPFKLKMVASACVPFSQNGMHDDQDDNSEKKEKNPTVFGLATFHPLS